MSSQDDKSAPVGMGPTRTENSIDAHIRVKCSKCSHEADVWIEPMPFFVDRINELVAEGQEATREAVADQVARYLDYEMVNIDEVIRRLRDGSWRDDLARLDSAGKERT
jgi:hypothetical protein